MKLRSLFLASIAALAMASCSNEENEVVDNAGKTETGLMEFGISMPVTRATEDGLPAESGITKVTIVLKYNETGIAQEVINLVADDFVKENNRLSMKAPVAVPVGTATPYVFINGTQNVLAGTVATDFEALTTTVPYNATSGYDVLGIVAENNFLMSNANDKTQTLTFEANKTTTATVKVDRVAAKLEEKTPQTAYEVATQNQDDQGHTIKFGKKLTIKITGYAYVNLNQEANILTAAGTLSKALFQPWNATLTPTSLQYKTNVNAVADASAITYCLENNKTEAPTAIVYKAKALWDGTAATESFYTYNGQLYMNLAALKVDYPALQLVDNSSIADFQKVGVRKYENGNCYYKADIKTAEKSEIVRNNVYKLKVNSINKLGTTTPGGSGTDATLLRLDVEIAPWTINLNDFEL